MYTQEKLESETFTRLYKHVGKKGTQIFTRIEDLFRKQTKQRDLNIHLGKESFVTIDDIMYYNAFTYLNNNGKYLKTSIKKQMGSKLLDISLEIGNEVLDMTTIEKEYKPQAKVEYSYQDNVICISKIEDEEYYSKIEDSKKEQSEKGVQL